MANNIKKLILTGVFALSGAVLLAACDEVSALPASYETPIVNKGSAAYEDEENKLGQIYDAIASNKSGKVVSTLLEELAKKEFGTYDEIIACFPNGVINNSKADAHIKKYKHEFVKDEDTEIASEKSIDVKVIQRERLSDFYNDINERINKVIFDEISSDSYRDTINKTEFLEEKYARAKRRESYDIKGFNADGTKEEGSEWKKVFIDNSFKEENVRDYLTDFTNRYKDYLDKKVVPDVYKDKLVEEYIIKNNYSSLGRAYGRKINYVKIDCEKEDSSRFYELIEAYVSKYIDVDTVGTDPIDYSVLVNWVKGFEGVEKTSDTVRIKPLAVSETLTSVYGEPKKLEGKCEKLPDETYAIDLTKYGFAADFKYYEKTKLGAILKNYEKAVVAEATRFASDEDVSQYNDFTNNGQRSKEQGLLQKITDLALENYSKDGWFVKNDKDGSLSALPETVKNRLFNIRISNDFDKGEEDIAKISENNRYFDYVHGHRYLTLNSDYAHRYVLSDDSVSSFYIVELLEAPSTSKLNIKNANSYLKTDADPYKTEGIARQIAKILGTKDTYTTNAYTSYLKLYTFTYHDTSVYDYMKATYPDLFED